MTVLDTTITPIRLRPVVIDLYRDIHKGIRAELFAVVSEAGRLDPADEYGVVALAEHVRSVAALLEGHAAHEDQHVGPVLEQQLPFLAERIAADHEAFGARVASLAAFADDVRASSQRRQSLHELYLELADFTGVYLLHQDVEERDVNPALEEAIGVDAMLRIHMETISTMPPHELIGGLAVMLPAMNIDDRTDLLGGMQASAPPEAFAAVWSLAGSVLAPADYQAVSRRLGLG